MNFPMIEVVQGLNLEFRFYECTEGNIWIADPSLGGLVGVSMRSLVSERGAKRVAPDGRFSRTTFYRVRKEFVSTMGKDVINWLLQKKGKGNIAAVNAMSDEQVSNMLFGTDSTIIPVAALVFFIARLPAWTDKHPVASKAVDAISLMIRLELQRMAKEGVITDRALNQVKELMTVIANPSKLSLHSAVMYDNEPHEDDEENAESTNEVIVVDCNTQVRQPMLEQLVGKMISERKYKAKVRANKGVGKLAL